LTRNVGKVTYMLRWVVKNKEVHEKVSKLGLEKFGEE
jgi:hypothetical protein